ncbi:MAG TPA: DUF1674 domain-containing protein [Kiloniellaceae bacterium]|nr:DUF1674 domain-containing protein [Kiloniellaceae bacterium]HIP79034.1 DUF1674 domain-containing protein [Kiloniellaceae bacterium]
MFEKFTARKPKPRETGIEPLQAPAPAPARNPGSEKQTAQKADQKAVPAKKAVSREEKGQPKELGGPSGPEPTRYGDWERKGICVDF